MATVNLGSIKFKWKGTYSGATAYTVDDVVEYNGSSYICILASTGNLPTNATYFEQMSQAGTNGTDGTDFGTILTTQGDIVYRDGSGIQRLGAGTSGQVLQTGGTGANPSWVDTSGGDVVLVSETASTSGTNIQFTDIFSSTYKYYHVLLSCYHSSSGYGYPRFGFLSSGTSLLSANSYNVSLVDWGHSLNNPSSNYTPSSQKYHDVFAKLHPDQVGTSSSKRSYFDMWFYEPSNASVSPVMKYTHSGHSDTWVEPSIGTVIYNTGGTAYTGFQINDSSGATFYIENFKCYGHK